MDRVGLDVTTAAQELNINDDKIVDMIKVLTDAVHSVPGIASSDDHIAGRTKTNLSSDVSSKVEMSIGPFDEDLEER